MKFGGNQPHMSPLERCLPYSGVRSERVDCRAPPQVIEEYAPPVNIPFARFSLWRRNHKQKHGLIQENEHTIHSSYLVFIRIYQEFIISCREISINKAQQFFCQPCACAYQHNHKLVMLCFLLYLSRWCKPVFRRLGQGVRT